MVVFVFVIVFVFIICLIRVIRGRQQPTVCVREIRVIRVNPWETTIPCHPWETTIRATFFIPVNDFPSFVVCFYGIIFTFATSKH